MSSKFLEEVKKRRSVRSYDGNGVSEAILGDLRDYTENVSNPYGIKIRMAFLDAKEHKLSSPVLTGEKLYISAMMIPGEHAEEAYGYSFEALQMHALTLGLGTVWIGGTMPRDKFEVASKLENGEVMPCVTPIGTPAQKMSLKEGLMRKGVKADTRAAFEKIFYDSSFDQGMTEEKAQENKLHDALEAVRWAPSAVNKQPWRIVISGNRAHFYVKHDKGYTNGGYDLQKIDVGIALYHFEKEIEAEGRKAELVVENPGIATPEQVEYLATYIID